MAKKKAGRGAGKGRAKKAARSAPKKAGRKPGARRTPPKKAAGSRRGSGLEPVAVKSGRGAPPAEVGADLVSMFNRGQLGEIEDKWWSRDVVSCEGGMGMEWRGMKAVHAKNAWWGQDHAVRGASAEGPYVGATGFSVKFRIEVETKSTGAVETMEEVGVYTVRDGKIVREEFMGLCAAGASGPVSA
jgi:hypothetical protein